MGTEGAKPCLRRWDQGGTTGLATAEQNHLRSHLLFLFSLFLARTPLVNNSAFGHLDSWLVVLSMPDLRQGQAPLWML